MTIYVDDHRARFRGMVMSHLLSDESIDELNQFAVDLGLSTDWLQMGSAPHYDVSQTKRQQALKMGAVPLVTGTEEWLAVYRKAKNIIYKDKTK